MKWEIRRAVGFIFVDLQDDEGRSLLTGEVFSFPLFLEWRIKRRKRKVKALVDILSRQQEEKP